MHCIGYFENPREFWWHSLAKSTDIHHNSGVSAFSALCANYDGILWIFPRNVIGIRMNFRNSLYNAPAKQVSNYLPGDVKKGWNPHLEKCRQECFRKSWRETWGWGKRLKVLCVPSSVLHLQGHGTWSTFHCPFLGRHFRKHSRHSSGGSFFTCSWSFFAYSWASLLTVH